MHTKSEIHIAQTYPMNPTIPPKVMPNITNTNPKYQTQFLNLRYHISSFEVSTWFIFQMNLFVFRYERKSVQTWRVSQLKLNICSIYRLQLRYICISVTYTHTHTHTDTYRNCYAADQMHMQMSVEGNEYVWVGGRCLFAVDVPNWVK